ncbi:helix-turn-helix domain-containing protein [Streptomyces sp. NPDC058685]|uniref:helix-turn-helix domain-containing protein n=1 Tax=Streptomyces sp. NPDC058685 TaxID=3346598 RepID=UPI003651B2E3
MDFKIRENRQEAVGRRALVRERAEYVWLMGQGFTNTQACRIVGINRRTGKRWRHGRQATGVTRGAPPVLRPLSPDRPSCYLREPERTHRFAATACRYARAPPAGPTSRTPRRPAPTPGGLARSRERSARTPELRDFIQDRLAPGWSPEQICQALCGHASPTGRRCT